MDTLEIENLFFPENAFQIIGADDDDRIGASISGAGDFNGDGFADIIVGAPDAFDQAKAYVIYGKAGATRSDVYLWNLTAQDGFSISGLGYEGFRNVSSAGDINNDGLDDLIISNSWGDIGGTNAGEAYVIYGKAGNSQGELDLSNLAVQDGFAIFGAEASNFAGNAVSSAGDVNNDGISDLIIGTTEYDDGGDASGGAFVIYGEVGSSRGAVNLSTLAAEDGFFIQGDASEDRAGWSVAGAGDINGDGIDDLIVGAPRGDDGGADAGEAYVIFGQNFVPGDPATLRGNVDLSNLNSYDGFVIRGANNSDRAGTSVASAGDINGDGIDDLILGAPYGEADGRDNTGEAYVIFGQAGPTRSNIDLSSLAETDGFTVRGAFDRVNAGFIVSPVGDFNGDGLDDAVIGTGPQGGIAYIVLGREGSTRADIDLFQPSPLDAILIEEDGVGDFLPDLGAWPVSGVGDVNGDGFDEVLFGAPGTFEDVFYDRGTAIVIYGFDTNIAPVAEFDSFTFSNAEPAILDVLANDSDLDGDALTVDDVTAPDHGTATINPDNTITFTADPGFSGFDGFTYTISDEKGATDSAFAFVTITASNGAPMVDSAQTLVTLADVTLELTVDASDPDDDALIFSASTPANGSVSGGTDGLFSYTPQPGFVGQDSFTVTIDDGNGGTTTQAVTITTQNLPVSNQFVMFTADGFTGGAGGSGTINGTDAFQQISVIDVPGSVALDPSFNKGGDVLQLAGNAADWNITRSGSSALFSDGDTFVTVPIGNIGLAVQFDDGVRELIFDGSNFTIGGQAFATGTLSPINAAPDGTSLPPGADPAAKAVLFIAADAGIAASGVVDIFGSAGNELASLISGNLTLDASFNRGGDTIAFDEAATDFFANQSGSSVRVTGSDTTALIPVGTTGATLAFGDGSDTRTVLFDTGIPGITIGGQQIGIDPVMLAAA